LDQYLVFRKKKSRKTIVLNNYGSSRSDLNQIKLLGLKPDKASDDIIIQSSDNVCMNQELAWKLVAYGTSNFALRISLTIPD
jgi:hypothetical protein